MNMKRYIASLKDRLNVRELPYLRALHDGSFTREDFVETQIQFLFAVAFFSRPMAALANRLTRPEMRRPLLENIADEHGRGVHGQSHEATFLQLLERLGASAVAIDRRALWPEVRTFNTTLAGTCLLDDVPTAMAALGAIEDLFATISARIGAGIAARGWLTPDQIVHYAVHERLDEMHAEAFYHPLVEPYRRDDRTRYQIEQGLELGTHLLVDLYAHLWSNRARRMFRSVVGSHSAIDSWPPATHAELRSA
jgi:pyrroloquinoline quinone (PQQ) biosynthesis protein C